MSPKSLGDADDSPLGMGVADTVEIMHLPHLLDFVSLGQAVYALLLSD